MPLIESINIEQLKLPLGAIKVVELIVVLLAYSARSGWDLAIKWTCAGNKMITHTYEGFSCVAFTIDTGKPIVFCRLLDKVTKCNGTADKLLDIDHSR